MSLSRTLEPEPDDLRAEVMQYELMDHSQVNLAFVDDLIAGGDVGPRIIDLGCGPALIPIEICRRNADWIVMGIDSSIPMLDSARMQIDFAGMLDRVFLEHADAAELHLFNDELAHTVVSNTLFHHMHDPSPALRAAMRMVCVGGRVFVRDLARPETHEDVERLVALHASKESEQGRQLLRQSLHAALTLQEIRELCSGLGIAEVDVQMTSDRHWTLDWQRPASK